MSLTRVEGLGEASERGSGYFSRGAGRRRVVTGLLKGLDAVGAGSYHQRRWQGGLGIALSRVIWGIPVKSWKKLLFTVTMAIILLLGGGELCWKRAWGDFGHNTALH